MKCSRRGELQYAVVANRLLKSQFARLSRQKVVNLGTLDSTDCQATSQCRPRHQTLEVNTASGCSRPTNHRVARGREKYCILRYSVLVFSQFVVCQIRMTKDKISIRVPSPFLLSMDANYQSHVMKNGWRRKHIRGVWAVSHSLEPY